jgi:urease accessory protein
MRVYRLESRADVDTIAGSIDTRTAVLKFSRSGSRTVLSRSFATAPLKLFATRACGCACWVYSSSLGGGLVGGDEIRLSVDVDANARALVTTQASTKVYRSLKRARLDSTSRVADGALLAVVPDPIVCFADADFVQTQRYQLGGSASLVMVDWFTSGRHAAGERWAFKRYETRIDVNRDGKPVLIDALALESDLDAVSDRMGRIDAFATVIITGPLVSAPAADLLEGISSAAITRRAGTVVSAARLPDGGTLLRMAATDVEEIGRALRNSLAFLAALVGDDPWSRKW